MMDLHTKLRIEEAQTGNKQSMGWLIEKNAGLIWSLVKRFTGRGVDTDDLYQLGCMGFIKAVKRFDTNYGTQFSTYAVPMICGEIRRYLRDDSAIKISRSTKEMAVKVQQAKQEMEVLTGREPTVYELAEKLNVSPEEIASSETAVIPLLSLQQTLYDDSCSVESFLGDEGIEDRITENLSLRSAIDRLDEKEKQIIKLRFYKGLTQTAIAKIMKISQVQVSRIERKAIIKLREWIQ